MEYFDRLVRMIISVLQFTFTYLEILERSTWQHMAHWYFLLHKCSISHDYPQTQEGSFGYSNIMLIPNKMQFPSKILIYEMNSRVF